MVKIADMLVADLMKSARTINRDMKISDALGLMKSEKIDFLSVVDEKHMLIGAVSENNFIRLVKHDSPSIMGGPIWFDSIEPDAGKQPVKTIMTTGVTTISPNENIATALKVMNASSYKLLHVVDSGGKLLGIVRMKDIFENLLGV